jgi:NitT/TauT family transport system permease protein
MREPLAKALPPVIAFAAVLLLWQGIVWVFRPAPFLLPGVDRVAERFVSFGANWPRHLLATVESIVLGFAVAVVFGVAGAVAIVYSETLRRALTPLLVTLQIVPKIAFAPLILVWFGIGLTSKVTVAFLVAFFPVLINTAVGLVQVEPDLLDLARSIKASPTWVFFRIRFPNSLPYFFAGLRVASTLAVIGAIIGEFVGSDAGLGYLIVIANNQMDTALGLAAIFLVSAVGLALYGLILAVERLCTPWAGAEGGLRALI